MVLLYCETEGVKAPNRTKQTLWKIQAEERIKRGGNDMLKQQEQGDLLPDLVVVK